jgi:DNA-binding response OmpR family regulator
MNSPTSDGNETVIDIFVLCKDATEAPIKTEHLEQKGYRVTLFSDSPHLLETLRFGKPNILICDSLSLGGEAYEICRQIKADNDLWMVPVLILTSASSLADLLFVLDCNADNFIACPTDPSYLLSLIEGMLVTPVEPQTPEQIKTQFKIQHDDHLFVVTADRRKLLEFLLSSFEIAVNKSQDLERAQSENAGLVNSVQKHQESAAEQTRVIGIMNSTLQQKEQEILSLNAEQKEKTQQIADLSREKEFLVQERETSKSRIAASEDENRALLQEKKETALAHTTETADLRGQVSALTVELTTTTADLAATKKNLAQEITRREDAETSLGELISLKEQAEKSLRAMTLECEQAKSTSTAEKNRAQAAEQEIRAVLLAKTQSEQDLTRIIDELKETAGQQAGELTRIRDEKVADKNRITSLETQVNTLTAEKETAEIRFTKTAEGLKQELGDLHTSFDTTAAALEEKNRQYATLEQEYRDQKTRGQQLLENNNSLKAELESVRSDLEKRLGKLATEKERVECSLKKTADDLKRELGDLRVSSDAATAALEEKNRQYATLEQEYRDQKTQMQQQRENIIAQKTEIDMVRSALEQEKQQHVSTVDSLQEALRQRDTVLSTLQGAHNEVKTDLHAHRDDLVQVKSALAVANEDRIAIKRRLEETLDQIHRLETNLQAASGDKAQSVQQIRSLTDELGQVKAALETERRQRRSSEENLTSAASASAKSKEDLRLAIQEQERLKAVLEEERQNSRNEKEHAREKGDAREHRIQELISDLASATNRQTILEEKVQVISREKREAEQKAASMAAEIDQARTALADEWEDHMTDQERLAAAVAEKNQLEKSILRRVGPEPGVASGAAVVAGISPSLPVPVPHAPRAIVTVPTPHTESAGPRITGIEDLFEDDDITAPGEEDELPVVTIVHDPDPEVTLPSPPLVSDPVMQGGDREESGESGSRDDHGWERDEGNVVLEGKPEDDDDVEDTSPVSSVPSPLSGAPVIGFSFNRTQWFDLLKWAHHSGVLSQDQRLQIIRMGRLIQKGRKLTRKQDEQVRELIGLVQSLGYRFA